MIYCHILHDCNILHDFALESHAIDCLQSIDFEAHTVSALIHFCTYFLSVLASSMDSASHIGLNLTPPLFCKDILEGTYSLTYHSIHALFLSTEIWHPWHPHFLASCSVTRPDAQNGAAWGAKGIKEFVNMKHTFIILQLENFPFTKQQSWPRPASTTLQNCFKFDKPNIVYLYVWVRADCQGRQSHEGV